MRQKPTVLNREIVASSRLFRVEAVQLRFSNGAERTYERLRTPPIAAVMMVPLLDDDTVVLIREYGAGLEEYQLTLPKGALDDGEDWRDAADRELRDRHPDQPEDRAFMSRYYRGLSPDAAPQVLRGQRLMFWPTLVHQP